MDQTQENWAATLNEYDKTQRPNANAIADMAVENWYEMSEKVADPKFQLRKKVESTLEKNSHSFISLATAWVTYTLIPYSTVQQAGILQDQNFGRTNERNEFGGRSFSRKSRGLAKENLRTVLTKKRNSKTFQRKSKLKA